jgi:hypothetical protein
MANTQTALDPAALQAATNTDLFAMLRALNRRQRKQLATQIVGELRARNISGNEIARATGHSRRAIHLLSPAPLVETTAKEEA